MGANRIVVEVRGVGRIRFLGWWEGMGWVGMGCLGPLVRVGIGLRMGLDVRLRKSMVTTSSRENVAISS